MIGRPSTPRSATGQALYPVHEGCGGPLVPAAEVRARQPLLCGAPLLCGRCYAAVDAAAPVVAQAHTASRAAGHDVEARALTLRDPGPDVVSRSDATAWPRVWCGGPAKPIGAPSLRVELECDTRPERNVRNKWATIGRTTKTREALGEALAIALGEGQVLPPVGPWCVRLTRLSPGRPDDDGLPDALKAARDTMAAALGVDDGQASIAFCYAGERRKGPIALRVEVWGPEARPRA